MLTHGKVVVVVVLEDVVELSHVAVLSGELLLFAVVRTRGGGCGGGDVNGSVVV